MTESYLCDSIVKNAIEHMKFGYNHSGEVSDYSMDLISATANLVAAYKIRSDPEFMQLIGE